ncbi:MBL fold metallo-hydrolase [Dyella sp. 2HG41-7]|uniref:MBL fold metallo-hydrolase n=1 Tax=Dyella sp. 2HG41-7 TaxID=2883239 RepID=UPI001F2DA24D|nr:MBL fold metallo-hydrolase [Dyella sp. 2HG41-7]
MKSIAAIATAMLLALVCLGVRADPSTGSLDMHWSDGAADCSKASQPPLEVHRYDAQTYILRESPCATFEAPFMYLLIGANRAVLIDSGDVADPKQAPLAQTVTALLPTLGASKMPLLVVHTHGHLDHRRGDVQFQSLPHVQIVPTDLAHVKNYFGFGDWPRGVAQIELGGRTIDVLPTPGHYPSHISFYDRNTGLFFSGDFFLPGRLIINDATEDEASAQRVADFIRDRPVTAVLAGHIEMDAQGNLYDFGATYHPNERALPLEKDDLLALPARIAKFNGFYTQDGVFVMLDQGRVLAAGLAVIVLALGTVITLLWRHIRRRKRRRLTQANVVAPSV